MKSDVYVPGSTSARIDSEVKTTKEWMHDIYHSPFKEELIKMHGAEAYEEWAYFNKCYRGCKDAKGGIEAARRWREL